MVKLADIGGGSVQPLAKPDIEAEARLAAAPIGLAGQIAEEAFETYDTYKLLDDQEKAIQSSNEANAVLSYVNELSSEQTNLNRLPPEIAAKYRSSQEYNAEESGYIGDEEFTPTHKVSPYMLEWAEGRLGEIYGQAENDREQTLYTEYIGKSTQDAFANAAAGFRSSKLKALTVETNKAIEFSNASGNLAKSLGLIDNASATGIYDESATEQAYSDTYKYFRSRDSEIYQSMQDEVEILMRRGETAAAQALADQYNTQITISRSYGDSLMTQEEKNEYSRKFRVAAATGEIDGNVLGVLYTEGHEAAIKGVMALQQANEVPEQVTQDEYDKMLSGSLSKVQSYQNALNQAYPEVKKKVSLRQAQASVNASMETWGAVPNSGTVYKDFSAIYDDRMSQMRADNVDWQDQLNFTLDYSIAHGNIPKGVKDEFNSVRNLPPERQVQVAEQYAVLRAFGDGLTQKYTGENKSYLEFIADEVAYGGTGSDSIKVVEQAEKRFSTEGAKTFQFNLDQNAENIKESIINDQIDRYIEENFETGFWLWSDQPEMQEQARIAWRHHYIDEIGRGATPDNAYTAATDQTNSIFGVDYTDTKYPNGKLAVLPPNKVYGDFVQDQLEQFVADKYSDLSSIEGGQFYLEADGLSRFQPEPTYKLMFRDPDNPDGYQVQSWNRESPSGVAGMARWKPDIRSTKQYQETMQRQRDAQDQNAFITDATSIVYDAVTTQLANTLGQDIPRSMAVKDVRDVLEKVAEDLKQDPRFWTEVEIEVGRGGQRKVKTVFDDELWASTMRRMNDAAMQATREYEQFKRDGEKAKKVKPKTPAGSQRRARRQNKGQPDL